MRHNRLDSVVFHTADNQQSFCKSCKGFSEKKITKAIS